MVNDHHDNGEDRATEFPGARPAGNPLFQPQREFAGAVTFDRFGYQYDWALYEFLELYRRGQAHVVFMEFHEDVVFSSSSEPETASFVFCQVKAGGKSSYTAKSLTKLPKSQQPNSKTSSLTADKQSVLAKLFSSLSTKQIDERVEKVRLIATAGFSLKLSSTGFRLEEFAWTHLDSVDAEHIRQALRTELGSDVSIDKLHFCQPLLAPQQHDLTVMGLIATLISERSPKDGGNSREIYLLLNDELRRKGAVAWDYADWDELVRKKGLTGSRVEALFAQFCSSRSVDELISDVGELARELAMTTLERRRIRQAARDYELSVLAGGSIGQIQAQRAIREHLNTTLKTQPISLTNLHLLVSTAPQIVKDVLPDIVSIQAAYLIEHLRA
ncbi:hypothetical protein PPN31114_03956 [Pandoraea pneumonica]|uniref:CD-NTase associated protein 4-like DNA endonuclease domain-containing protein n=1 Tax=Pandoraea pneumonica TaxID=2508299 RepID=A0A5E4XL58_9BURK|nr:dsDNA nuclease domain-containing protein [Pandoraea pneumonica]VVE36960.1 hypothetical protein PPN31114_03956 [Pandoraea pneumonica]